MTPEETTKAISALGNAYPNWKITADTIEVYSFMLRDIDYEIMRGAIATWIASEEYPPTVAGLRKMASELIGTTPLTADLAWGEVRNQVRMVGRMGSPKFSDDETTGATRKTVDAFGWVTICLSENPDVIRGQFFRAYENMRARAERQTLTAQGVMPSARVISMLEGVNKAISIETT